MHRLNNTDVSPVCFQELNNFKQLGFESIYFNKVFELHKAIKNNVPIIKKLHY